jgi:hypothetical protein
MLFGIAMLIQSSSPFTVSQGKHERAYAASRTVYPLADRGCNGVNSA